MQKYAVLLSYTGTKYCGWQKQKRDATGALSVQEVLESKLQEITQEEISLVGSGRTDAGVHASGQVGHFVLRKKAWDTAILQNGMNSLLPDSIRVLGIQRVEDDFHAQRSAVKKQYSYYFQQGPSPLPHLSHHSWWIRKKLDQQAMREGISFLVGKHDFLPFRAAGAKPGPSVREIFEAEVVQEEIRFPGQEAFSGFFLVRLRIMGSGFLKQMVRGIAGTLLQVGEGRRPSQCFQKILSSQDRSQVGPTAPSRALWLERVWYEKPIFF